MAALLAPGLLKAVDDPNYSGTERKAFAIGQAASGHSIASTTVTGAAYDCIEQPDGKIVVVGNNQRTLIAMRFHANGTIDTTFGDNGVFVLPNYDIWYEGGMGVALQSSGSIVLVAKTYRYTNPNGAGSGIVVRLTPAGQLDTSFATAGVKLINGGDRAFLNRVFVTPDDKIVTGGNYPSGIWFARYLADGAEDVTFGSSGKAFIQQATQNNHSGQVGQLVLLPDGKMLMLSVGILSSTREAWVVDRVSAAGAIDSTFSRISLPYDGTNTYIGSMARLNDGRIAVAIPRTDSSYPIGDMVGLYSAEGVREGAVSDSAFAGSRDRIYSLLVRSDGSLCGGMKQSVVQFLPVLQKMGVAFFGSGVASLVAVADGGILKVQGSSVFRYSSGGSPGATYTLSGTTNAGHVPEIVVEQMFSPISSGGSRSFGSAAVNGIPSTLTFTIRNTGLGSLTGLAISVTGTHAEDFTVTALASDTVVSGGGQNFTVSFAPKAPGARTATLQIASNDADENPFDIIINGQGVNGVPEIEVQSSSVLNDGDTSEFRYWRDGGKPLIKNYIIYNSGTAALSNLAISVSGANASEFTPSALASSTLAPGKSQSFSISFATQATGTRSATLQIASNDANENPFDVVLVGNGDMLAPDIALGELLECPHAQLDCGSVVLNTRLGYGSFQIQNKGEAALSDISFSIDGPHASEFAVYSILSTKVGRGDKIGVQVSFAPKAVGVRTATLHIKSNDPDEGQLDVALTGRGGILDVSYVGLADFIHRPTTFISLGSIIAGRTEGRSVTIRNTRTDRPVALQSEVRQREGTTLALSRALPSSLAPGESFTFTMWFAARLGGTRSASLSLLCDQELEVQFAFEATVLVPRMEFRDRDGTTLPSAGSRSLFGWGLNTYDQAEGIPLIADIKSLAAGSDYSLALHVNGAVSGWGAFNVTPPYPALPLRDVVALSARYNSIVAVRSDGTIFGWGDYGAGSYSPDVPMGLTGIAAVSVGATHSLALSADGSVVTWGHRKYPHGPFYSGVPSVPSGLTGVVAIAAGGNHSLALKGSGNVIAWGENTHGQASPPVAALSEVVAIAAGSSHSVALKYDGSVIVWGSNQFGQTQVPVDLAGVTAISAGLNHTVALCEDGTVVAWGANQYKQTNVPKHLTNVAAVAAGDNHTLALGEPFIRLPNIRHGTSVNYQVDVGNRGTSDLHISKLEIEGDGADQFSLLASFPNIVTLKNSKRFTLRFDARRVGLQRATLKFFTNDPINETFVAKVVGVSTYDVTAARSNSDESVLTYGPLAVDRTTGGIVQKVSFANPTGSALHGLRLILSRVVPGLTVISSSVGTEDGTLDVIYSKLIAAGETVHFYLSYYDARRRTSSAITPLIRAEALPIPEPRSKPVLGVVSPIRSVRDTVQGPLVEWNCKPGAVYVVEYSDDRGATWFSAVHRLTRNSTRMMWVDRGQPETFAKPTNKAARSYRVKRL